MRTISKLALQATTAMTAIALAACSSAPREPTRAQDNAQNSGQGRGILWNRPHSGGDAVKPFAAAGAHLSYNGGPVISNINVYTVAWGPSVLNQSTLNSFFTAVTNSPYLDWLSEYNTPNQSIGRGAFGGAFVDPSPPAGSTINDSQIQAEISSLIDAGTIPAPDANSYYQIIFPPGVTVVGADGTQFCVQTAQGTPCAYHSTFTKNGVNVYYSPQPDYSGACGDLCGFVPNDHIASLTTASSHEMVEAITDAAIGINNLAWYDNANGEIGDICEVESQGQQIAGFFVQTEWSNSLNKCIVSSGTTTCTPQCGGKQCGSDGCQGSCGTCSNGQTCDATGQCTGGTMGCAHPICATGAALTASCDPCAAQICASDSFCCNTQWDNTCLGEVGSICGQTCM